MTIGALKNIERAKNRRRNRVNITLRADVWAQAQEVAEDKGMSASRLIETLLKKAIRNSTK